MVPDVSPRRAEREHLLVSISRLLPLVSTPGRMLPKVSLLLASLRDTLVTPVSVAPIRNDV